MDTERLYQTVSLMLDEDDERGIQQKLDQLDGVLGSLQNQPTQSHFQSQAVDLRDRLTAEMRELKESTIPAVAARIDELGGKPYFSPVLSDEIEYEMQRNAMAPAVIASKVSSVASRRKEFLNRLNALQSAMDYFHVAEPDLKPGDADIVFVIPSNLFKGHLEELSTELAEINKIIQVFSEAVTGAPEPVEVRRISSSVPSFYFHISPATIEAIGKTITWLISTFKGILDIRKLRQEAEKVLGKEQELKPLFDQRIEERIESAVQERTQQILESYKNGDTARRNELGVALNLAQRQLLFRIERGMSVELRVNLPEGSTGQTDIYAKILQTSHELEIPVIEGPPILKLPSSLEGKEVTV